MEIVIGMRFEKRINKTTVVECYVSDILECSYKSLATNIETKNTKIIAKSNYYGMGNSFEVPKATVVRGILK